jgi:ribosomal protein L7/L12
MQYLCQTQSKELVEGVPKVVAKGLIKADAEALAAKLNEAGGTAEVE